MKPFFWKIVICLVPNILAGWAVWRATDKYMRGEGGFKLGVDLVGGTILVYEIDASKQKLDERGAAAGQQTDSKLLAAYLQKRIDPNDLHNVVIRMVGDTRVEIILPTGGQHRSDLAKKSWDDVIAKVKKRWGPEMEDTSGVFDVGQGRVADLADRIKKRIDSERWPKLLRDKDVWNNLKTTALNWNANKDEVNQVNPGNYEALIDLIRDQRKGVDELRAQAQKEDWTENLKRLKKWLLKERDPRTGKKRCTNKPKEMKELDTTR